MMRLNSIYLACCLLLCPPIACGAKRNEAPPAEKQKKELTLAEISRADHLGRNMLHEAVIANDTALLETVIAKGAELDGKDTSGRTALHYAVEKIRHEALKILIDHGADISMPMPNGGSPVKCAVMNDDIFAAESLHLCSRNRDILLTKGSSNRPLAIFAVKNKHYSMAELFIRPLHYIVKHDKPEYLAHLLAIEKLLLRQRDEKKMMPLHIAYLYRNDRFIEMLKAAGADEEALDAFGKKPADYGVDNFSSTTEVNTLDDRTRIKIDDRMLDFLPYHDWMTIGIIKDGKTAFLRSYGRGNMIDQDASHASVSKPMTSLIFMQLLKKGLIGSLDDDIALYSEKYRDVMPAAFAEDKITFRQILTHTSGIPHLNKPLWAKGKLNLLFKPGARFEYSTNAFSILGEIMAEVTGRSFPELVKEYIGRPIGATSFWAENEFRAPAARIHSTTRDFAKFAAAVINNTYLSEKEFDELLIGKHERESLGWGSSRIGTADLTLGHSGSNGRPRSHLLIKPKKKIALVLMGQTKSKVSDIWFMHLAPILLDIIEGKGNY